MFEPIAPPAPTMSSFSFVKNPMIKKFMLKSFNCLKWYKDNKFPCIFFLNQKIIIFALIKQIKTNSLYGTSQFYPDRR